jgi:hypothetical protein
MRLSAGPPARPENRTVAFHHQRVLVGELERARALADNWRKGVAGLLIGIVGFSLIRGRSEVDKLTSSAAVVVGIVLAIAALTGTYAAFLILRAAHGSPRPAGILSGPRSDGQIGKALTEHDEAMLSYQALSSGLRFAAAATVALLIAVAITWYGPAKAPSGLMVTEQSGATWCGHVEQTVKGLLTLKTSSGPVVVDLRDSATIKAVDECPKVP